MTAQQPLPPDFHAAPRVSMKVPLGCQSWHSIGLVAIACATAGLSLCAAAVSIADPAWLAAQLLGYAGRAGSILARIERVGGG